MKAWDPPPPCLPGPVHQSVWQTGHTGLTAGHLCAARRICIASSLQQKRHLSRSMNRRWSPGLASRLCGRLPPPSLSILNPPPTPSIPPPLPCPPFHPPTPNWLWKMASVSHLGTKIKGKLQPTSMQNVIWKPPSYVLTIDFSLSSPIPSLSLCPFLLISPLHFYPSTILRSVKFEEKSPPNPLPDEAKKEKESGACGGVCVGGGDLAVPSYACLHLESILWCK